MKGPFTVAEAVYQEARKLSREVPGKTVRVYKVLDRPLRYVCFDAVPRDQIDGDDVLLLRSYFDGKEHHDSPDAAPASAEKGNQ